MQYPPNHKNTIPSKFPKFQISHRDFQYPKVITNHQPTQPTTTPNSSIPSINSITHINPKNFKHFFDPSSKPNNKFNYSDKPKTPKFPSKIPKLLTIKLNNWMQVH